MNGRETRWTHPTSFNQDSLFGCTTDLQLSGAEKATSERLKSGAAGSRYFTLTAKVAFISPVREPDCFKLASLRVVKGRERERESLVAKRTQCEGCRADARFGWSDKSAALGRPLDRQARVQSTGHGLSSELDEDA